MLKTEHDRQPRMIPLSAQEMETLKLLGGVEYIHTHLETMRRTYDLKHERNKRIVADSATTSRSVLAYRYGITVSAVGRIVNDANPTSGKCRPRTHKVLAAQPATTTSDSDERNG